MKTINVLVVIALAFGCASANTVDLNGLVDQVLASANELIAAAGKSTLSIPSVSTDWHQRWHFIKVSGSLTCDNGHVGTLNTLKRTGDASMTTNGNTITVKAQLGLGDLNAEFDTCRAKVHHILSVHSRVEAKIDSESISFQLSVTHGPNNACSAKLDSISLDSIGKVSIKTGGGVFNKIIDKLLDLIANHMRGDIRNNVNSNLTPKAQAAVAKNAQKLCERIPH